MQDIPRQHPVEPDVLLSIARYLSHYLKEMAFPLVVKVKRSTKENITRTNRHTTPLVSHPSARYPPAASSSPKPCARHDRIRPAIIKFKQIVNIRLRRS